MKYFLFNVKNDIIRNDVTLSFAVIYYFCFLLSLLKRTPMLLSIQYTLTWYINSCDIQ